MKSLSRAWPIVCGLIELIFVYAALMAWDLDDGRRTILSGVVIVYCYVKFLGHQMTLNHLIQTQERNEQFLEIKKMLDKNVSQEEHNKNIETAWYKREQSISAFIRIGFLWVILFMAIFALLNSL